MDFLKAFVSIIAVLFFYLSPALAFPGSDPGSTNSWVLPGNQSKLSPEFYIETCPEVNNIVMEVLGNVISKEPRMAASLLRLHFHDCFVQGCDALILLDNSTKEKIFSEKGSGPNKNSVRGFEVIDEIKAKLEKACPRTVSCADILALAARGSTMLSGGPSWELPLGRRDSKTACLGESNVHIPAPNFTVQELIAFFNRQGLNEADLVALSGFARCGQFKQRLYNQNGSNLPDATLEKSFYNDLKTVCPKTAYDNGIFPLDFASPAKFDNSYFKRILMGKGLLNSDQVLLTGNVKETKEFVKAFARNEDLFFGQFAKSIIKLGSIRPLRGSKGEIRKNCLQLN